MNNVPTCLHSTRNSAEPQSIQQTDVILNMDHTQANLALSRVGYVQVVICSHSPIKPKMARLQYRLQIRVTRSIQPPCPIHGMRGSRKTSCNGLANKSNLALSSNGEVIPQWPTSIHQEGQCWAVSIFYPTELKLLCCLDSVGMAMLKNNFDSTTPDSIITKVRMLNLAPSTFSFLDGLKIYHNLPIFEIDKSII